MPIKIENITDEAHQGHTIIFGESEIALELRYHPTVQMWVLGAEYKGKRVNGIKLSCGVLHFVSMNLPFDFIVSDTSGNGIDPFRENDFALGRCELYMLNASEMETYRGAAVPV